MNKSLPLACLWFLIISMFGSVAHSYQFTGGKWPQPSSTFYVDIPGANGLWNEAFEGAMYEWNTASVFTFSIVRNTYSDPCTASDNRNGVRFHSSHCGDSWGGSTLAIATTWTSNNTITETDIVFNSNESWDVYSGPWQYSVNDFRRVAIHELGHTIGLDHEDSGIATIMGSYAGDTTLPQQDDVNGVSALYGISSCTYTISPTSKSFSSSAGSVTVSVTTSCGWTASESLSWASLSQVSGTGDGSVTISVLENTGLSRSGTITIAGESFSITQSGNTAPPNAIYRFYNSGTGTHFYTSSADEAETINNTLPQFIYEGIVFSGASDSSAAGVAPVHRFYNSATGTHFYTISDTEKDTILSTLPNYIYEGESYYAYTSETPGTTALHRFYNTTTGTHFYTNSEAEKTNVQNTLPQYTYEGIVYYVD